MITLAKLEIYRKRHGDIDSWARTSGQHEQAAMNDADWFLIETLIQDIKLAEKELASVSYSSNVYERLVENCDSRETIDALGSLAKAEF